MLNKLKEFFRSFKSGKDSKDDDKDWNAPISSNDSRGQVQRTYNNEFFPLRKIFIWGWDQNNNPAFLVLYGFQEFLTQDIQGNQLKPEVDFKNYMICRGEEGHFPSFESAKVTFEYNYKTGIYATTMYYGKANSKKYVEDFKTFSNSEKIIFPYPNEMTHRDFVRKLREDNISFDNFRMADSPMDVLQLDFNLEYYYDPLYSLFCNPNIYTRKKTLKNLIAQNPPSNLYQYLMRVGSGELISGLFMELAASKNNLLEKEAKELLNSDFHWSHGNYKEGIKRCAHIYLNIFDGEAARERVRLIEENLEDMDLTLISIDNQMLSKDKKLEGKNYKRYADQGLLSEYFYQYDYKSRKTIRMRRSNLYKETHYCDGASLNINRFKNTIQEAELYGIAEVIGRIAYFTDAPRLEYHFKGNRSYKSLKYFKRYLRRILERYALEGEAQYVKAMKVLLTSYEEGDYLGSYQGNFQKNYFIKKFLYHSFDQTPPVDWIERFEWVEHDQHLKLEGRYDYKPEIWDRHLIDAVDIAISSKIEVITKAFYYILKEADQSELESLLSPDKIVSLADSPYEPLSLLFSEVLKNKLEQTDIFEAKLLLALFDSRNPVIQEAGMEYFTRTKGRFSSEELADLLFLKHLDEWSDLIKDGLRQLDSSEIHAFISTILHNNSKFAEKHYSFSEELEDILEEFLNRLEELNAIQKGELAGLCISELYSPEIPKAILSFMEKVIFLPPLKGLEDLLEYHRIDSGRTADSTIQLLLTVLKNIRNKKLPTDSVISEMLKTGSSKMLLSLAEMVTGYESQLHQRESALLLFLEADFTLLNEKAKAFFEALPIEEQRKMHFMIIDSPVSKVNSYGMDKLTEFYEEKGDGIPKDFLLPMMEHSSEGVRTFISDKISQIIQELGRGDQELFLYYSRTLLYLPNKSAAGKKNIYALLPKFVEQYRDKQDEVEELLLDLGGSNKKLDSERALVALAKIKKGVVSFEG